MKITSLVLAMIAIGIGAAVDDAAAYFTWNQSGTNGLGDVNNTAPSWYGELGGYLFLGTSNTVTGGEMFRCPSGYNWYKTGADGFGNANNTVLAAGATFGGALYAGTRNTVTGCQVWSTSNGATWTQKANNGFGDAGNVFALPTAILNDTLYATTFNQVTGAEVWRTADGTAWTQANTDGFGDSNNREAYGSVVLGGYLYVGTRNDVTGGEVWRTNGGGIWTQVNTDGFGDGTNRDVYPLAVLGGYIYAGTKKIAGGAELWRSSDGTTWTQCNTDGFADAGNTGIIPGGVYNGYLYVGTENSTTGGEVWKSSDGTTWTQANTDGFGDSNNVKADRVRVFENNLYAATENSVTGIEVWRGREYTETTVYAIQQETFPIDAYVKVDSVVVTAMDKKPDTFGFWGQELAGGPWSGILCYSWYDRPDLTWGVEVGDLVSVIGNYQEYPDIGSQVSEIEVDSAWVLVENYGVPPCTLLSCQDLTMIPVDPPDTLTERWEGVFLCVDTVRVSFHMVTEPTDYMEWSVKEYHVHTGVGGDDSLIIDDKLVIPTLSRPDVNDTLSKITGVFSEEYGTYKLWPRGTFDLEFMGPSPGPHLLQAYATSQTSVRAIFDRPLRESSAETIENYYLESETEIIEVIWDPLTEMEVEVITATQPYKTLDSLTVCDVISGEGYPMDACEKDGYMAGITPISWVQQPDGLTDASQLLGEQVTVKGIATSASPQFGGPGAGPFFMRDSAGAWNGIFIYDPNAYVELGDTVVVSGSVDEFNGFTEIGGVDYFDSTGGAALMVLPDVVTPDELTQTALTAESWEGCLVKMDSAVVFTYRDENGEWRCGIDPDTVAVGDYGEYDHPGAGNTITITGCYRYHFGEYKMEPRDSSDITYVAGVHPDDDEEPVTAVRLYQNAPNPFVNGTMIRFAVPTEMKARLAVYDVRGRLVNVLADGLLEPGNHMVQWDGRDRYGAEVSSGIYFYRFLTPTTVLHKKMVLLK